MSDSIWAAAKRTIRIYLIKLCSEHKLSSTEIDYDILFADDKMVTFVIHNTLKELIEGEIKKRSLKKKYQIEFSKNGDVTWRMELHAGGYESYIFAGMLNGIVSDLDEAKEKRINSSKEAIHTTIAEVIASKEIKGKHLTGLKYEKGVYYISLRFKEYPTWRTIEFKDANALELIATIAKNLPAEIERMQKVK